MEKFLGDILYYFIEDNLFLGWTLIIIFIGGLINYFFHKNELSHHKDNTTGIIYSKDAVSLFDVIKLVICAVSILLFLGVWFAYFFTGSHISAEMSNMSAFVQFSIIATVVMGIAIIGIFFYILFHMGSVDKLKEKRRLFIGVILLDLIIVLLFSI